VIFLLAIVIGGIALFHGREASSPAPAPVAEASAAPALPSATPPPAVAGVLLIDTQPSGAAIRVNGEGKGVAPLELGLPVGNYEIRAELKGYEPKAQIVNVSADTPRAEVRIALSRVAPVTGSLEVVSTPAGGSVSIDGSPAGETPLADLKLKVGSHKVEIAKEGFEPWQGSVSVEAGKKARVDAPLKAVAKATSPSPQAEVADVERVYQNTAAEVDTPARKISGSSAEYPKRAPGLRSGQSVSVSVSFVVNEKGDVEDVKVLESAGRIVDDAVVSAFRSWKYEPAVKQGQKEKVKVNWKQTFRVD
jgi:TonB family protein